MERWLPIWQSYFFFPACLPIHQLYQKVLPPKSLPHQLQGVCHRQEDQEDQEDLEAFHRQEGLEVFRHREVREA